MPGTVMPITQNRAKHRTSMLCLGGGFGGASGSRIAQCRQKSLDGPVSELHAENLMSRSSQNPTCNLSNFNFFKRTDCQHASLPCARRRKEPSRRLQNAPRISGALSQRGNGLRILVSILLSSVSIICGAFQGPRASLDGDFPPAVARITKTGIVPHAIAVNSGFLCDCSQNTTSYCFNSSLSHCLKSSASSNSMSLQ